MNIHLTFEETRLLGALFEKEKTTPDQYPLSLNALTNACNQKSNRDPVVSYGEMDVQNILDELCKKHLVSEDSTFGSRVTKYKHRFANSSLGGLQLTDQELAIITVLFLRGPQTPGELRSRTNRLCKFENVSQTEEVLRLLIERSDGPFVALLDRVPGQRERRYAHLFSGDVEIKQQAITPVEAESPPSDHRSGHINSLESRLDELEQKVAKLEALAGDAGGDSCVNQENTSIPMASGQAKAESP